LGTATTVQRVQRPQIWRWGKKDWIWWRSFDVSFWMNLWLAMYFAYCA